MMKKVSTVLIILLAVGIFCYAGWRFLDSTVYSSDTFSAKTYINGVNCSNMTAGQAKKALTEAWNKKTFNFEKDGDVIAKIQGFDLKYDIDSQLKELKRDHLFKAAVSNYFKTKFEADIAMTAEKPTKKLVRDLKNTPAFQKEITRQTKNAYVDLESKDFEIIPEVYGDNLDYQLLAKTVTDKMAENQFTLDYEESAYYEKPTLTASGEEMKARREYCRKYLVDKITYTFGDTEVAVTPAQLDKMMTVKSNKEVLLKKKAIKKYVKELASEHTTIGTTRNFKSYSGNQISVSGGIYGYAIDTDKEAKQLGKDLKSLKKVKREPVWAQKGWGSYDNDIGSTYVEISIGQQHLWYFKDGKQIVSTPVVTGNVSQGYSTPTGVFQLTYKERDATLNGYNSDGSSYASPVSYWMPFYGNYGMHDAPWRGAFGGSIYQNGGSHGCVNMPVSAAGTVFNNLANSGTPIIVH